MTSPLIGHMLTHHSRYNASRRFFKVLLADNELERSFCSFQTQITAANIIYSSIQLLLHDAAWYGFASHFFKAQTWLSFIACSKTCEWLGTAPWCIPDECPAGKIEIVRAGNVIFKFLDFENPCSIGEKLLCCDPKVVRADRSKHCMMEPDPHKECPAGKIQILERRGTHRTWGEKLCCDDGTLVFE